MNLDATFRPFVIVGFLAIILITLPHRIKSQATGEKLDRMQEGPFMLVTLRLAGAVLWVSAIAYMIDPAWMAWSSVPLPIWLRWTAVGLFALTAGLLLWTLRSLGTNLTDTVVTRQAHTLVTRGPYRWVRHPFYDCMAMFVLSIALMAANWFVFAAGVVVFALLSQRGDRSRPDRLVTRGFEAQAHRRVSLQQEPTSGRSSHRVPARRRLPRNGASAA